MTDERFRVGHDKTLAKIFGLVALGLAATCATIALAIRSPDINPNLMGLIMFLRFSGLMAGAVGAGAWGYWSKKSTDRLAKGRGLALAVVSLAIGILPILLLLGQPRPVYD
jgi:MFS family permease